MAGNEEIQLAEDLAEVALKLMDAEDVHQTLQRMVGLAVTIVDGCDHAGLSLVVKRHIETPAQSDEVPETIDAIQNDTGEGPCIDAIRRHEVYESGDLTTEDRWPDYSDRVVKRTGVHSVLAMRLFVGDDTMGALNLYATPTDAFDDDDRGIASIFAAHASVALQAAQKQVQLERAVESRDIIGQAKGILMARRGVDEHGAFAILIRTSNHMNRRLRDVAHLVIEREQRKANP